VAAVSVAVERARKGDGPSLIEAVTYRMGPHTTSDDPGRYREESDAERWRERDPLLRVRKLFENAGEWSEEWEAGMEARATERIEQAVSEAEALPVPRREEMFHRMYAEITAPLRRQLDGET
jgi:pyruvate dehydrogenase E1 component alpha subunit